VRSTPEHTHDFAYDLPGWFNLRHQTYTFGPPTEQTSKECPGAKSSNERSFSSLGARILTNREGKYPKGTFFHRTDEGAPGREAAGRRLACTKSNIMATGALASKDGKDVRLISRNKKAFDYLSWSTR
jgi:hypothetical protein